MKKKDKHLKIAEILLFYNEYHYKLVLTQQLQILYLIETKIQNIQMQIHFKTNNHKQSIKDPNTTPIIHE
ncbi:hypothetical protein pb186bvf_018982 [Paramecium bursaria]